MNTRLFFKRKILSSLLCLLVILFLPEFAFSEEKATRENNEKNSENNICLFTPKMNWSVTAGGKFTAYSAWRRFTGSGDIQASLDMKQLYASTGFQFGKTDMDWAFKAIWAPNLTKNINLGIELLNHIDLCYENYLEHDFLPGLYFKVDSLSWFRFQLEVLFHLKNAQVFALKDSMPWIKSTGVQAAFRFDFLPVNWVDIFFKFSSYDYYNYKLSFSPITTLGVEFSVIQPLAIGILANIQYVDFFTLSANFSNFNVRLYAKYKFKEVNIE